MTMNDITRREILQAGVAVTAAALAPSARAQASFSVKSESGASLRVLRVQTGDIGNRTYLRHG
jgi:hypothetical protein